MGAHLMRQGQEKAGAQQNGYSLSGPESEEREQRHPQRTLAIWRAHEETLFYLKSRLMCISFIR